MPNKLDFQLIDQIANADGLVGLTRLLKDAAIGLGATGFFCSVRCARPVVEPVYWAFSSNTDWNEAYRDYSPYGFNPMWEQVDEGIDFFSWQAPEVLDGLETQAKQATASNRPLSPTSTPNTEAESLQTSTVDEANPDGGAVDIAASSPQGPEMKSPIEFWSVCKRADFQQGFTICVRQEPQWTLALSIAAPYGLQIDLNVPYDLRARLRLVTLASLHSLVRHVMPVVVNQSLPKISGREISCLKWAARGKTASEISTLIGVSEATVVFHLNNLMKKLRVSNRTQAIAVGISMGLTT